MISNFLLSWSLLLIPGFANIIPVLVKKIPFLNYPIDFGKKIGGREILGKGKTWRGLFFGSVGSGIFFASFLWLFFESWIIENFGGFFSLNFSSFLLFTFLLAFGALLGDLVKSFFKRLFNVPSGNSWFPFDQIDWLFGSLLIFVIFAGWQEIVIYAFISGFFFHLTIKFLGYILKIDNKPI